MQNVGMIIGDFSTISEFEKYGELVMESLKWAAEHRNEPFVVGQTLIADGKVAVNAQAPTLAPVTRLEAHRKFIDIHVPISGTEILGWAPVSSLNNVTEPYNADNDIEFFGEAPVKTAEIKPGQFVIFYPADAHAPNMADAGKSHQKYCIKIPVD